jgi:hypothetical protein
MAGKNIPTWIDERTAREVETLAKAEARPSADVVAAAVKFYLALPEGVRAMIRDIDAFGTPEEVHWAMRKVAGALIAAQYEIAAEKAAAQMHVEDLGPLETEAEIEAAAVRLTKKHGDRPLG